MIPQLERAHILLVEDNANDVLLIRRAFKKLDLPHAMTVVGDGDRAVRYLAGEAEYSDRDQHPLPTLVLLDLKLPRRSGYEVLQWIRSATGLRRLPVVILTSSGQDSDVVRCYEAGANSYLLKPVIFDELVKLVDLVETYWAGTNLRPPLH